MIAGNIKTDRSSTMIQFIKIGNNIFSNAREMAEYYKIKQGSAGYAIKKGIMPDGTIIRKIMEVKK